jgi:hypothetical protein
MFCFRLAVLFVRARERALRSGAPYGRFPCAPAAKALNSSIVPVTARRPHMRDPKTRPSTAIADLARCGSASAATADKNRAADVSS